MDEQVDRAVRLSSVGLLVTGVVHLLAPRLLLSIARRLYRLVLGVRFEPTAKSPRRVRLLGLCMLAMAGVLARQRGAD